MLTEELIRTETMEEISKAVRLHYFKEDKFNTNVISVVWTIPAKRDTATKVALLSECINSGKNPKEREKLLAEMYGAVFESSIVQKGGRQLLALSFECVTDKAAGEKLFKNAVSFMRDALDTKVTEDMLEKAKNRLNNSLDMKNDSPSQYAVERLIDTVYPDDAFSVHCDGYKEDIDKIKCSELNDLFNDFKTVGHTDIFISGDVDRETAVMAAESFVKRRDEVEKLPIDEVHTIENPRSKTEKRNVGQSRVAVLYSSDLDAWGKEWYTALVLKEILCGAGSSLLYDNVRQKNGLCYYIGGKIMRFRMAYVIDAGVAPGNEEKTVELIDECIKNFCVDEDCLKAAKMAVVRDIKASSDRRMGRINNAMNKMLLGITIDHDFEEDIKEITLEDIRKSVQHMTRKGVFVLAADKGDEK